MITSIKMYREVGFMRKLALVSSMSLFTSLLFPTPYLIDVRSMYTMCDIRFFTLPRIDKKLRVLGSPSS